MGVVIWLLGVVLTLGTAVGPAEASKNHHYDFFIKEANHTRLCHEKTILTVNGQFPGPTIFARKGDVVVVNVYNQGDKNITIHWHGVDQPRNPWYDGPEYITQCPIQPGANLTYTIILSEEEGTLWWHAHSDYDRTTIHGAIVIHPKLGTTFPFKKPHKEIPVILSEWWNADVNHLLEEARRAGGEVSISDANTINGQPGDLFPCSRKGTFKAAVESGKTYLLRIINAGLANDLFFGVAGHRLTVVGTDARYTKPFTVDHIFISPGQTVDALLEADRGARGPSNGRYYMAARTLSSNTEIPFNNSTATAILEYADARAGTTPDFPNLPAITGLNASLAYTAMLRSLGSEGHPVDVPAHVDEHMLITLAINVVPCGTGNGTCEGPGNNTIAASLNNVSFHLPSVDILDAYYGSVRGVFEADFPNKPPFVFNFTDDNVPTERWFTKRGTKVKVLEFGAVVEVVFQDTAILGAENHPMHLHGFAFYVVGRGFGNFNETTDPASYNLIDPPFQNTVTVPKAGWAAIRFRAANPGVWFMHCHFERHSEWGMDTVFIVKDGKTPQAKMMPRPPGMPRHGVDQPRNPWYDGPEYISQCPIQPGANLTYTIILSEEEGTLITLAINVVPCGTGNGTCEGPGNNTIAASLNNVSFHLPSVDILDAYYGSVRGVFEADFPNKPPFVFNFTDDNVPTERWFTKRGTKVKVLEFGAVVEVVFQDTAILGAENHPMHLHGFAFYVVGRGFGNFNETTDPASYNLIDPPFQNTVTVPKAGWAAIRFRAANPGVWFMHCHFERHSEWGMDTVFIVKDGKTPQAKMMRRPPGMPMC